LSFNDKILVCISYFLDTCCTSLLPYISWYSSLYYTI